MAKMLEIHCTGTPWEIGYAHGSTAKIQVAGSLAFYRKLFLEKCAMTWDQVTLEAGKYTKPLERTGTCQRYLQEIDGLAAGAGVHPLDILALNVRTEIMFGLFTEAPPPTNGNSNNSSSSKPATHHLQHNDDIPSEGCTSLAWIDYSSSSSSSYSSSSSSSTSTQQCYLAQNWDWQTGQKENLVICHVSPRPSSSSSSSSSSPPLPPNFTMVTEAGIIGKIGFNAHGVGCCLNAIRARGVDPTRLPVHFALRTVLESRSRAEALAALEAHGVAGSAHILVAEGGGGGGGGGGATGLECSPVSGIRKVEMDAKGRVYHTNHLVLDHPGVEEPDWLADSHARLARIQVLAGRTLGRPGGEGGEQRLRGGDDDDDDEYGRLFEMFQDQEGWPCSINRKEEGESTFETLFTIIMNLTRREARVKVGRPTEGGEVVKLTL